MRGSCSFDTICRLVDALEVEEIAALSDDALRNYLITHSYHRLDDRMRRYIGPNLSWVGFGAWASELAGRCIRGEQVPLQGLLPEAFSAQISHTVARGNQWVYADIAPVFRNFDRLMADASTAERATIAELATRGGSRAHDFVRESLSLDPRPQAEGGQALLCGAFEQYLLAAHERNAEVQAERVFVANAAIGLHEQTHLDPMIQEMMAFPLLNQLVSVVVAPMLRLVDSARPALSRLRRIASATPASRILQQWPRWTDISTLSSVALEVLEQARQRRLTHAVSTRFLLALPLGDSTLPVGRDVSGASQGEMFPDHLRTFDTHDPRFRTLLAEVLTWDRTPDTVIGSAASDWSDLGDRMNFILALFRTRQQNPALFQNPLAQAAY